MHTIMLRVEGTTAGNVHSKMQPNHREEVPAQVDTGGVYC